MRLVSLLIITATVAACAMTDPRTSANAQSTPPDAAGARRIWAGGWFGGSVSPSGDLMAYRSEEGQIRLRKLATGDDRLVATIPGDGSIILSNHGDKLLFGHTLPDGLEITVMNTDGTGRHVLKTLKGELWAELWGWSPDDQLVTVVTMSDSTGYDMQTMDATSGAGRTLRKTDHLWLENPQFSRDGRYIAYTVPVSEESDNYDIHVMNRDGSGDHVVVGTPGYEDLLAWSASGESLYYLTDDAGGAVVMEIPMRDGTPAGTPVRLKGGLPDVVSVGATPRGVAYASNTFINQVLLARVDLASARLAEPVRTLASYRDAYIPPNAVFSPDGAYVAWATTEFRPTGQVLHVRSIASGEQRDFKAPSQHIYQVAWNADGTAVDMQIAPNIARTWQRLTLATGAIALAPTPRVPPRTDGPGVEITNTGGKMLVVRTSDNKVLYSNRPEVALRTPPGRRTLIANDEAAHQIISLPLVDGAPPDHVMLKYPSDRRFVFVGFAPDTSLVYALRSTDGSAEDEVWVVADGSAPRRIFSAQRIEGPQLSPDGRYVSYRDRSPARGEVWLLEK